MVFPSARGAINSFTKFVYLEIDRASIRLGRFHISKSIVFPLPICRCRRRASPSGECVGDHPSRPRFDPVRAPALTHRLAAARLRFLSPAFRGMVPARHRLFLRVVRRLVRACRADTEPQGEVSALQTAKIRDRRRRPASAKCRKARCRSWSRSKLRE